MTHKILVVDDDPDTLRLLGILLTRMGYQTMNAVSGKQALKLALQEPPDLIVLDVMMPEMDGYETARQLRRRPKTAKIPILMFTAKSQTQDKVVGYEAGADLYLIKPIHPIELNAHVKVLLAQKQALPEKNARGSYVVGVAAAKGGQGVSTVALNLAIACQRSQKTEVVAVETRPGQGSWASELGLREAGGLVELLQSNAPEITQGEVEKSLARTSFGIRLLLASENPADVGYATALAQYTAIIDQLAQISDLMILDIGTNFHPAFNELTELCDEIILVTEPQPVEVKRAYGLIEQLKASDFGRTKKLTAVTVNHRMAEVCLSISQVEEMLSLKVTVGFPPAPQLAHQAGVRAEPMYVLQPEGEIARLFNTLAEAIANHISKKRG